MLIQVDKKVKEKQEYQAFVDALAREAKSGHLMKQALYKKRRLRELGQANHGAYGMVEGLGQLVAQYDADMWFQAFQQDRYHWADNESVEQYKRDNPEVIVTR